MADFVAVIRRAVDGLATNTPEMRAKVYDKARGAVQRQLENMKPRPPEDMLRRQMDKLEAAIVSVEQEHAEALPAEEEIVAAPVIDEAATEAEPVEAYSEPAPEPAEEEQPVEEEQPQEPEPEAYEEPVEEPATAVYEEPVHTDTPEDVVAEQPAGEQAAYPAEEAVASEPVQEEPVEQHYGDWREDLPADEPEHQQPVEEPVYEDFAPNYRQQAADNRLVEDFPQTATDPVVEHREEPSAVPVWEQQHEPAEADTHVWQPEEASQKAQPEEDWGWEQPADKAARPEEAQAAAPAVAWDEVPDLTPSGPVVSVGLGSRGEPVEGHFGAETHVSANAVRMPSVSEFPEATQGSPAVVAASADPFAEYLDQTPSAPAKPEEKDPWSDLEELIGFDKTGAATKSSASSHEDDADDLMPAPARPYRVTPAKKRNYAGIILGVVGLLVVGGGAYALWLNRDSLNDMVDGLFQSGTPATSQPAQQSQTTPPASSATPAQQNQTQATPPARPQNNAAASTTPPAAPRPADGTTSGKFTQRLMPDGSEVDSGPGGTAAGTAQNAEGRSVAQLNTPPAAAATPPANGAATTPPPAAANTPPAPAATPATTPAVAGEKIFLYEERVGQSAPTAIDGTVSWSLQREPGANGRQQPVIQGRITIPARGLTALMTVKRNADPSLPASHLVEIVFAVPPDFEGGAIDSVQRIALKSTEQDRGNALIAVPAKITDDFHMIALNDFPDARNTNMELLRSRNWIDIPVAYRNGRRALITLQKGAEGERVFNDAIREWAAMGNNNSQ